MFTEFSLFSRQFLSFIIMLDTNIYIQGGCRYSTRSNIQRPSARRLILGARAFSAPQEIVSPCYILYGYIAFEPIFIKTRTHRLGFQSIFTTTLLFSFLALGIQMKILSKRILFVYVIDGIFIYIHKAYTESIYC